MKAQRKDAKGKGAEAISDPFKDAISDFIGQKPTVRVSRDGKTTSWLKSMERRIEVPGGHGRIMISQIEIREGK